jgi:serine/threonine-protein kinase
MNSIIGKILRGRYYIVKELGKGGFSVTYLAQDRDLPGYPLCAVKRLQPRINNQATWQNAQKRFITEAVILQKLGEHPQIPKLLAYFEENQEFYLVQEFIDGDNLEQEIQSKLLNEVEATQVLKDVLEVLSFVHDRGVIHRDIKPSNLIRRHQDRKIVLIDFGAVKEVTLLPSSQQNTNFTNIIGTMNYMPPEQMAGQPNFSSDIYALGKTITYALTGEVIDEDSTTFNVVNNPHLVKLSPKLTNILNTMTKESHHQRYQSAKEVLADLKAKEFSFPSVTSNNFNSHNQATLIANSFKTRNKTRNIALFPKILKFIALLLILGVISSVGLLFIFNSQQSEQFITYENKDYHLVLKYPETWVKQDIEDPITGEIVAFASPTEGVSDLFQEKIIITIEDLAKNTRTLEDYQEEIIDKLGRSPDLTIEKERRVKLANKPAYKIVYSRQDEQIDLQQMEVFTIRNDRVYVLTYIAERAKYSKFLKTAERIINSFEFN